MIAIVTKVDTTKVLAMIKRLEAGFQPSGIRRVVERESFRVLADMVKSSPKKWFGQIRSGWRVDIISIAKRVIEIDPQKKSLSGTSVADIAAFVDRGTANDGAGYIYPVRAKRLYIPLKRRAAAGFQAGFVYGEDYILRSRVRGIKGRHYTDPVRKRARENFREAILEFARKLVRGHG